MPSIVGEMDHLRYLTPVLAEDVVRRHARLTQSDSMKNHIVRIFPNSNACRRLIRALAVETHENRLEAHRYLNMNDLREHKKIHICQAA
jgi:putative transposase